MTVVLRPIDRHNWREAIRLNVAPEQRTFVASNLYSIAEAGFEPGVVLIKMKAAYEMVGFLMFVVDKGEMWVWRPLRTRRL